MIVRSTNLIDRARAAGSGPGDLVARALLLRRHGLDSTGRRGRMSVHMAKKRKTPRKPAKHPKGFWDRSDPSPAIISVRNPASRLARASAFLLRLLGWGRRPRTNHD